MNDLVEAIIERWPEIGPESADLLRANIDSHFINITLVSGKPTTMTFAGPGDMDGHVLVVHPCGAHAEMKWP